jgi:hypothetical protein
LFLTTLAAGAFFVQTSHAQPAAPADGVKPAGKRVYYASHSLMWDVPPLLGEAVNAYGIKDHTLVGVQRLGFSRTIQHWENGGGQNEAKRVLEEGKVDVFVMSPIDLPDPGIDNFVELGLKHNANMKFLLQVNWGGFDQDGQLARQIMGGGRGGPGGGRGGPGGPFGGGRGGAPAGAGGPVPPNVPGGKLAAQDTAQQPATQPGPAAGGPGGGRGQFGGRGGPRGGFPGGGGFGGPGGGVDWNSKTVDDLKTLNQDNVKGFEDQVKAINEKYGKTVIYLIPISQATSALRTKIIQKEFPGLDQQSQLFADFIGHPTAVLTTLNMYCHFAVMYGQSPVGLPIPANLARANNPAWDAAFNKRLQELAWTTVINYPYSGVKASSP